MRWLLPLACVLLAACATTPPLPPVANPAQTWAGRQQRLSALTDWHIEGRIGIRKANDAWQGALDWTEHAQGFHLQIDGPFGQRQFSLEGDTQGVTLLTSDDKRFHARDAQTLLYVRTGIDMPVAALRYWVRGVPAPDGPPPSTQTLDDRGRLARLVQAGWEVRFRRYTTVDGLELPEKLFVRHGEVGLRLVIDRWRLLPASGGKALGRAGKPAPVWAPVSQARPLPAGPA